MPDDDISKVLQRCTVEGNVVKLPEGQLDRKLYMDVAKKLELIGGKWTSGKVKGFVFKEDPTELLAEIASGGKRNLQKEYQYFPTPDELADRMVARAEIKSGMKVLEPSAGQGAIIAAIHRKHPNQMVDYCELMPLNRKILESKHPYNVDYRGDDFMSDDVRRVALGFYKYDRIIANPPFSNNQDIDHVRKMWSLLKDGGRMVVIMSKHWQTSQNKKETAFREWLDDSSSGYASITPVPPMTFKSSGTNIATVMLTIDKP